MEDSVSGPVRKWKKVGISKMQVCDPHSDCLFILMPGGVILGLCEFIQTRSS